MFGMIQRGDMTGFVLEPIAARTVRRQFGRKHLQRDFTAEARVARPIDLAHAPGAERADDVVLSDACAWCHGSSVVRNCKPWGLHEFTTADLDGNVNEERRTKNKELANGRNAAEPRSLKVLSS